MLCSKGTASSTGALLSFFYSIVILVRLSALCRFHIVSQFSRGRTPTMAKVFFNFPHLFPHTILCVLLDGALNLFCRGDKLISLQNNVFAGWVAAATTATTTAIIAAATATAAAPTATATLTTRIGTLGTRAWVWAGSGVAVWSRSSCGCQLTVLTLRWRFAATSRVRATVTASKERDRLLCIPHVQF